MELHEAVPMYSKLLGGLVILSGASGMPMASQECGCMLQAASQEAMLRILQSQPCRRST